MPTMNKKGFSQIIAVVIFIALTLVSIGILVPSIFTLLNAPEVQLGAISSCLELQQTATAKITQTSFDPATQKGTITVRTPLLAVQSLTFMIDGKRHECGQICGEGACIIPDAGTTATLYFNSPTQPSKVEFYVNENCKLGEANF
jgi:flagellin-like protein